MTVGLSKSVITAKPVCIESETVVLGYNASEISIEYHRADPEPLERQPLDAETLRTDFDSTLLEDREEFISSFAEHIHARVVHGDHQNSFVRENKPTVFHGRRNAAISVKEYVKRIALHSKCSSVCFVSAYAYLHRLEQKGKEHKLCSRSVHRLLIASVLIATKLMDDKFYSNAYFARIGGISLGELNRLELEMLQLLGFQAFVNRSELSRLLQIVCGRNDLESPAKADGVSANMCRRSKKRVGEDVGSLDNILPAKLQHDSQSNQILVTKECSQLENGIVHMSGLPKAAVMVSTCHKEILRSPIQSGVPIPIQIGVTAGGE